MSMKKDEFRLNPYVRGQVHGHLVNLQTGEQRDHFHIGNVIAYTATGVMARVLGGDSSYAPGHMGFIYGAKTSPALIDPPISRTQDWDTISSELADPSVVANMQISPLALTPTYEQDGDSTKYDNNSTKFTAHSSSGAGSDYGFPTSGAIYAGVLVDGYYFYHATLLTKLVTGSNTSYLTFARVSLKDTNYLQKPAGFELALIWQVSFF